MYRYIGDNTDYETIMNITDSHYLYLIIFLIFSIICIFVIYNTMCGMCKAYEQILRELEEEQNEEIVNIIIEVSGECSESEGDI